MPDQDIPGGAQVLGIVERAYRGAVEKQFFDVLYMSVELHRQLGGMDILLRGPAVTCALRGRRPDRCCWADASWTPLATRAVICGR